MSDKNLQDIKDAITDSGSALLAYSKTGSVFLPLDGDLYVAVGSLAGIASVAGKGIEDISPAVQAQAELTDEEIVEATSEIYLSDFGGKGTQAYDIAVARAVLAAQATKARAGSSDVRAQALDSVIEFLTMQEGWTEEEKKVVWVCVKLIGILKANPGVAKAPAASKEGGTGNG
jgi:hypothetical protein